MTKTQAIRKAKSMPGRWYVAVLIAEPSHYVAVSAANYEGSGDSWYREAVACFVDGEFVG
mgnify:CR=1 FL=1